MISLPALAAVAIGGALGSVTRFWLSHQVNLWLGMGGIAWGTFAVNLLGSFAIGFVLIVLHEWLHADPIWRLLLIVGFLGGFTTFSTFSWDSYTLWMNGHHMTALLNVAVNLVGSLMGTGLGVWLARHLIPQ